MLIVLLQIAWDARMPAHSKEPQKNDLHKREILTCEDPYKGKRVHTTRSAHTPPPGEVSIRNKRIIGKLNSRGISIAAMAGQPEKLTGEGKQVNPSRTKHHHIAKGKVFCNRLMTKACANGAEDS